MTASAFVHDISRTRDTASLLLMHAAITSDADLDDYEKDVLKKAITDKIKVRKKAARPRRDQPQHRP